LEALNYIPLGIVLFLLGTIWWFIRTRLGKIEKDIKEFMNEIEEKIDKKVSKQYFLEFKETNKEDHSSIISTLEKINEKINQIEKDIVMIKASRRRHTGEIDEV